MRSHESGFTLVEMLLCVAIIALLAGLSVPIYFSAQTRNDTLNTAETIADALRRAETYARAVDGDGPWGINFTSTGATLFQGTSYAARVTSQDETITVPSDVTLGYTGDIIFAKLSGVPTTTPSITVTAADTTSATVTVNAKGMVNY